MDKWAPRFRAFSFRLITKNTFQIVILNQWNHRPPKFCRKTRHRWF